MNGLGCLLKFVFCMKGQKLSSCIRLIWQDVMGCVFEKSFLNGQSSFKYIPVSLCLLFNIFQILAASYYYPNAYTSCYMICNIKHINVSIKINNIFLIHISTSSSLFLSKCLHMIGPLCQNVSS